MSNTFSSARDLTGQVRKPGGGMSHARTFTFCPIEHKGSTTGAQYVPRKGWLRCAKCFAALKAGATAG
jgi:hypothetical protein